MKLFTATLIAIILFACCTALRHSGKALPFNEVTFTLVHGNINDSNIAFSTTPFKKFTVKFSDYRFRKFDGRFDIKGTSPDTGSVYHTSMPYTGFYTMDGKDSIGMYWFQNIYWAMDFHKHAMSRNIGRLFRFEGKYSYMGDSLFLYTTNGDKKDTVITMMVQ